MKVITVVAVFLIILMLPFLYNWVSIGLFKTVQQPELVIEKTGNCVKDTKYMRTSHGKLLIHERSRIVREGERGAIGLSTCRKCHTNREEFCDRCHNYAGVLTLNEKAGCFACHYYPKTKKEAMEIINDE